MGGNFQMDCMATLAWTEWQLSCGLGGRIPWNTQPFMTARTKEG